MLYLISIIFGLAFGSFANVCIARLPKDESIRWPRSHCPRCGKTLENRDNIPVLSFLLLRGRCRFCRNPISWQYPLIELIMAGLFVLAAWRFPDPLQALIADVILFYLLTLSVIDYWHRIIPDELSLSLVVLGILSSHINPFLGHGTAGLLESLLATFAGGAGMLAMAWAGEKLFNKEALGGGDIKLMAAFGAVLGWPGLFGSLFFGSLLGGLIGVGLILLHKKQRGETLPFGPFLSLGALLAMMLPAGWLRFVFP